LQSSFLSHFPSHFLSSPHPPPLTLASLTLICLPFLHSTSLSSHSFPATYSPYFSLPCPLPSSSPPSLPLLSSRSSSLTHLTYPTPLLPHFSSLSPSLTPPTLLFPFPPLSLSPMSTPNCLVEYACHGA